MPRQTTTTTTTKAHKTPRKNRKVRWSYKVDDCTFRKRSRAESYAIGMSIMGEQFVAVETYRNGVRVETIEIRALRSED